MKVYVAIEAIHYDTAEVLGVSTTVEGAKQIAEAHAKKSKSMKYEAEWKTHGDGFFKVGNYANLHIETHDLKE